jgi:hypothetical protein
MAKTTVALTPAGAAAAAALERFKLPEMIDVARLGFAYAVQCDLDLARPDDFGTPGGAGYYTASTGTLDQDRRIEQLVIALHPEAAADPYLAVETLINKGLIELRKAIESGEVATISDLLESNPIA